MRLLWLILLPTAFAIRRRRVKSLRGVERDTKPVSPPLNSNFPPTSPTDKETKTPPQSTVDVSGLIKRADGLETFEDLNKELCKAIEKDELGIVEASMILSNHELFQTDQLPLIEEAIKEGYNCYLKCMLNPRLPWAQNEADLHWLLAKSHGALWDVPDLWLEYQKHTNWANNLEAMVKADNVKFIEWLKKARPAIFKKLRGSSSLDGWIEKHDSAEMAKYFNTDLQEYSKGLKGLVQHGCFNIITMLVDNNVHLDLENVTLRDAYRYPNVLRLLYQNGFRCYPPLDMIDWYASRGRTDYLDIFHDANKKLVPTTKGILDAAQGGHLKTLQWVDQHSPKKLKHRRLAENAIDGNHFEILKWAVENDKGTPPSMESTVGLFRKGDLELLKWICEKVFLKDHPLGMALAPMIYYGRLDLLIWLSTIREEVVLNGRLLGVGASRGHLHILKWAYKRDKNHFMDDSGIGAACSEGFLEILRWVFKKKRRLPTMDGVYNASKNGHVRVLRWLYRQNPELFPNQDCIGFAALWGRLNVLRWVKRHTSIDNIFFHHQDIKKMIKRGRYMIIKWIAKTKPSLLHHQEYIDLAIKVGYSEIAQFIKSKVFSIAKEAPLPLPPKSRRGLQSSSESSGENDFFIPAPKSDEEAEDDSPEKILEEHEQSSRKITDSKEDDDDGQAKAADMDGSDEGSDSSDDGADGEGMILIQNLMPFILQNPGIGLNFPLQ